MELALLDTDLIFEVLKQRDPEVTRRAAEYLVAFGEFAFSALSRFAEFCRRSQVVPITDAILDRAGDLWAEARWHGQPRGDADLIIAATALDTGRVLVTGNTAHFAWVAGLRLENWRDG